MKLYVNEKIISLHNKFHVVDENGKNVYEISSKVISIGDKTTISDMNGNIVAYIEQRLLHLTPYYDVYVDSKLVFSIRKKFQLIRNDYVISNGYRVDGNPMMFNYYIFDDEGNQIGGIKRKIISIRDRYVIEINDESKKEIVLAIIVAISNDINRKENEMNNFN